MISDELQHTYSRLLKIAVAILGFSKGIGRKKNLFRSRITDNFKILH